MIREPSRPGRRPDGRWCVVLAGAALAFGAPAPAWAQGSAVREGAYVGLQYGYDKIGGEFDDTVVLRGQSEVIDVPRVKPGGGAGLVWGYRTSAGGGLEFGWHRSRHRTTSILLGDSTASLSIFDIDARWGLYNRDSVRAWVLFGLALPRMTIERSRVSAAARGDASYSGYGLNLGVGAAYHPTAAIGLTLDLFWRRMNFSTVQGTSIDGGLDGSGLAWRINTVWSY